MSHRVSRKVATELPKACAKGEAPWKNVRLLICSAATGRLAAWRPGRTETSEARLLLKEQIAMQASDPEASASSV